MTTSDQYVDDECIYIGGDPRLEQDESGSIRIGIDDIMFSTADGTVLAWPIGAIRSVGFQPGYRYTADEREEAYREAKRDSQARGMELAHFRMDDIPPGVLMKIADPEKVLPDGWPVHLGFRSVYFARVFERRLRLAANMGSPANDLCLRELLAQGESEQLEFKQRLTPSCAKGVTAFLNTTGGVLLIGVDDDATVCGIKADEFTNEDQYVLRVVNLLRNKLTIEARDLVNVEIVAEHFVCQINCQPSSVPVYYRADSGGPDQLFVRRGPSTERLDGRNLIEYCQRRF